MLLPFYFIAFLAGLIFGSFLNVCIYRLPLGKSIATPRSHCPTCGRLIRWSDNIPLLSFLFLKGKCRRCKNPIPARYFVVELVTGILAVAVYHFYQLSFEAIVYFVLVCALVAVTFIDIEHKEVPDVITLPGIIFGVVSAVMIAYFNDANVLSALLASLLGVVAGGGSMFLLGVIGEFIFRKEALGGGDVKLMAMIGAFIGWEMVILTFFLAPVFGSIAGSIQKIRSDIEHIAYAPYLCAAAILSLFWGDRILDFIFWGYGI